MIGHDAPPDLPESKLFAKVFVWSMLIVGIGLALWGAL